MGSCVSTYQKPPPPTTTSMKVKQVLLFGSPSNDVIRHPPYPDFGSKEETFFDSQAWIESDNDDDFMSVNGEFTPSRGNTPVHHKFSSGNDNPLISSQYQPSPNGSEKNPRLSDLFCDSQRLDYDPEFEKASETANKNGVNLKTEVMANSGNGLKPKRERFGRSVQNCFPSLMSSRSSSTNGRKMTSPGPSPSSNRVMG